MEKLFYMEDGSNDRKYFTVLPNYLANHSTATDQSLYFQMKRIAGESGVCFASKRHLMEQMGVGIKALNASLKYLLSREWIEEVGERNIETAGGRQTIMGYRIVDIWKKNVEFYGKNADGKGVRFGEHPGRKVLPKALKGASKSVPSSNVLRRTKNSGRVFSPSGENPATPESAQTHIDEARKIIEKMGKGK